MNYLRLGVTEYRGLAVSVQGTGPLAKSANHPADTAAAHAAHVDVTRRHQLATEEHCQIGALLWPYVA